MNKNELLDVIAKGTGLTKLETAAVVDGFLATIVNTLRRGESVFLRGFGTFKLVERAARVAVHPATGEKMVLPKRKTPVFRASKEFQALVSDKATDSDLKPGGETYAQWQEEETA